jgi:hypothetical protein
MPFGLLLFNIFTGGWPKVLLFVAKLQREGDYWQVGAAACILVRQRTRTCVPLPLASELREYPRAASPVA